VPPADVTRLCDWMEKRARREISEADGFLDEPGTAGVVVRSDDLLTLVREARAAAGLRAAAGPFVRMLRYYDEEFPMGRYPNVDSFRVGDHNPRSATVADLRAFVRAAAPEGPQ
jgi:hypothetical protein